MLQPDYPEIGTRLRRARRLKKLRLKDVALAVECSESLLSKIETNKVTPSLRVLHRIATVLDTSITSLFAEPGGSDVTIYRKGEHPTVVIGSADRTGSIKLERLIPYAKECALEGNIHVVEPGADGGGEIKHSGEEMGYVLEGEIELTIGSNSYTLRAGDSFFFRSELPHGYRNRTGQTARILWINTPPTF